MGKKSKFVFFDICNWFENKSNPKGLDFQLKIHSNRRKEYVVSYFYKIDLKNYFNKNYL